ncbi:MAG TPA: TadE family protein [Planktothrix sp.]|jgi:Flp pilus assembly protein TadG
MTKRRKKGQSIVELAVGLMALVPIVLVVFDLAIIVIGVQINDSTCREAARVAASGNPTDANARATAVVARANQRSQSMLSNFTLVKVDATTQAPWPSMNAQLASLQTYGGPVQGTVTVQTEVDIKPFIVEYAYNGKSPLKFVSQQTFPFTYVVPNSAPTL